MNKRGDKVYATILISSSVNTKQRLTKASLTKVGLTEAAELRPHALRERDAGLHAWCVMFLTHTSGCVLQRL